RVPEVADALDRMWPRLSPHELLHDLLGARPLLAAASRGVLTKEEQELLFRPRSPSFDEVEWTAADAALVDEARHLLGPRRPGGEELTRYGHIVVDEVQDLSPMQLRMLTRRSLSGSMTVVGDVAQATAPWAPADWSEIMAHLPSRRPPRTVELTVSYRTPAEVLELAGRILALLSPDLEPPRPVRRSGHRPRLVAVTPERDGDEPTDRDTARVVAAVAAEELAAVGEGQVAVLAPGSLLPALADALSRAGLLGSGHGDAGDGRMSLSEPLVLVATEQSNGLEFDAVVVVEPGLIAGETARGLRTLYVALTRPTRRLAVVHRTPPPAALLAGGP
ncbi:MAG TPA: UvrD-helicase domain-containing protein, partial [Acidimicrobiales bacterium]|nr:UvrD-helicase domain-containing protein [Acidimicrobiales bacterium]